MSGAPRNRVWGEAEGKAGFRRHSSVKWLQLFVQHHLSSFEGDPTKEHPECCCVHFCGFVYIYGALCVLMCMFLYVHVCVYVCACFFFLKQDSSV